MDGTIATAEAAYRRIEPLELPGFAPPAIDTAPPEHLVVDPLDLLVDEDYQRRIAERGRELILRIATGWDWRRFKPPIVARWRGPDEGLSARSRFLIVDGQHTAIAAATIGIRAIPVMIIQAPGQADQASAFLGHNRDRLNLTPMQLHFAALAAGEGRAVAMHRVADAAGARILRTTPQKKGWRAGDMVAVGALGRLIDARGEDDAVRVLKVLAKASAAPITADWIKAVEALLWDIRFGHSAKAIVDALELSGLAHLAQQAHVWAAAHEDKLHIALAFVTSRVIGKLKADAI